MRIILKYSENSDKEIILALTILRNYEKITMPEMFDFVRAFRNQKDILLEMNEIKREEVFYYLNKNEFKYEVFE